ncbi:MAG: biotin/lipoyl-containing protein [Myxococcota bacterium]
MMHYVAFVDGEEKQVEIVELAPDRYQVKIDERVMEVDARHTDETSLSLLVDHQAFGIESERVSPSVENLKLRGEVISVEVLDLRTVQLRRARESSAGADGPTEITSPMPGKVVAVLAQEGEEVVEGQGLLVVEAMKMENELRSPKDGVVRQMTVAEGDAVEGGARLCTVE